jgi:cyclopropane fatty-acyl-phospholipid synthase-like methyltransferase
MRSPLTGNENCTPVFSFTGEELVDLYRWQRGLDVSKEVEGSVITLWHDPEPYFCFFDPPCAGSEDFYRTLTSQTRYEEGKQEFVFASSHIEEGETLLDIGCGWGHFATEAPQAIYKGVELSEVSARRCVERGLDVENKLAAEVARDRPEGFDVVASFQVLEHVEDPGQFFADCLANVRPGGKLILSVPNSDSFMSVRENNYLNYPPHHVTWWSQRSLEYLIERHNLELVDLHFDRAQGNHLTMHYGVKIHRALSPERRGIRNGVVDRTILKLCDGVGKILRRLPLPEARGHSITVVCRRPAD